MSRPSVISGLMLMAGLTAYGLVIGPFTRYMGAKPIEEKLGYVPSIKLLKPLSADHRELTAASLVMKVTMYFGGLVGNAQQGKVIAESPDLLGMSRLLHGAVQLDPYNMDAYYFAQGFLTWDAGQFKVANGLLDYGMKFRTWDWYLPFFAGFNNAYFLKDYAKAASYYEKAGKLSGNELHINLAGRYMQESGQTEHAIGYLKAMVATSRNDTARKEFSTRLTAFEHVLTIEQARDRYQATYHQLPASLDILVSSGYLQAVPRDPYGGTFYLTQTGKVSTTSKFAYGPKETAPAAGGSK